MIDLISKFKLNLNYNIPSDIKVSSYELNLATHKLALFKQRKNITCMLKRKKIYIQFKYKTYILYITVYAFL
jgi:hypothetical protein